MDNDEGTQEYWLERAQDCWNATSEDDDRLHDATTNLADELKSDAEENIPVVTGSYADILGAALHEIDWYEIATNLLEDVDKEGE